MTQPRHVSLYDAPAYRVAEAAHMLALPAGTLKAWSFGQDHRLEGGGRKQFLALMEAADTPARLLSLYNLCELHTLAALRRHYRIPMPAVRSALGYLKAKLRAPRLLLAAEFLTNGIGLFVQHAGATIDVSRQGQATLSDELDRDLRRVERDARGIALKPFPVTRDAQGIADPPHLVVIDPKLAFGRPILAGAGVATAVMQDRLLAGDSLGSLGGLGRPRLAERDRARSDFVPAQRHRRPSERSGLAMEADSKVIGTILQRRGTASALAVRHRDTRSSAQSSSGTSPSFKLPRACSKSGSTERTTSQKRGLWFISRRWESSWATT